MKDVAIVGIDIAKQIFQLHGAAADGSVAFRKKLPRGQLVGFLKNLPNCIVAMEACATGHHWGREIQALGHEVRLIPPIYVKPFVKRPRDRPCGSFSSRWSTIKRKRHSSAAVPCWWGRERNC